MRTAEKRRTTKESDIYIKLDLDNHEETKISTGIGFFDHMLELFAFHAGISLQIEAKGDLHVCDHHTVEDCGIVLGECIKAALGDKKGIQRYGSFLLPMDEALAQVVLDLSNRAYLVYQVDVKRDTIGTFSCEMVSEFFRAIVNQAGITLHINVLYGENDHHKLEAVFKGFGRALREAIRITSDDLPSTKGML